MLPGFTKSLPMSQQPRTRLAARCINSHSAVNMLFAHHASLSLHSLATPPNIFAIRLIVMSDEMNTGIASDADRVVEDCTASIRRWTTCATNVSTTPTLWATSSSSRQCRPGWSGCAASCFTGWRRAGQVIKDERRRTAPAMSWHLPPSQRHSRNSFAVVQSGFSKRCRATPPQGFSLSA